MEPQPDRDTWAGDGVEVRTVASHEILRIELGGTGTAVKRLHLRWHGQTDSGLLVLGDHWERGYGDLARRRIVPERMLPWCAPRMTASGRGRCGVKTQGASIASWRVDQQGVSLWLERTQRRCRRTTRRSATTAAEVVTAVGEAGESALM